jgi:hypothetical protein
MKTKLSLAGAFFFLALITFGQTVPFTTLTDTDNTVPFPEKMDDVFGNLDLTDVTTDLLLDRAWPFAKHRVCNDRISANKLTLNGILINAN